VTVYFGFGPFGAENQIRREADQAVAPAHRPSLDRLQQKVPAPRFDQLQRCRDGCLGIGNLAAPDQRRTAAG
jgi:hypothetical protein